MADVKPVVELAQQQFNKKKAEMVTDGKELTVQEEAALFGQCMAVQTLAAPLSAKLPPLDEVSVIQLEDGKYKVSGFVDSQNAYGTYLRTQYSYIVYKTYLGWTSTETFVDSSQAAQEQINNNVKSNMALWWVLGIIGTIITIMVSSCETRSIMEDILKFCPPNMFM